MTLDLNRNAWSRVAFSDVVKNVNETVRDLEAAGVDRIIAMEHMDPGALEVARWGSTANGTTFTRRVRPGQTLFGKRRAYQRKVAYAEFDAICSGDIYTFEAGSERMLGEFLPFLVQSDPFFDHALGTSAGSLSPRTNWRDLAKFEFNLPPLDEQKRIASLLWSLEDCERASDKRLGAARAVYQRSRLALLTIGPRARWRDFEAADDIVGSWTEDLPTDWTAETIASIGRVRAGATPRRSMHDRYFADGAVPWVKTLDLNEDVLDCTEELITETAVAETSAKVVPAGTVLVAMYGGFGQIGRTARLGIDAATNQAVSSIMNLRADVEGEFLHEVLKAGRSKWRRVAASSRKDPNITKADVENFDFPLPPHGEQLEILRILGEMRGAIRSLESELAGLAVLKRSLSAELLGGQ